METFANLGIVSEAMKYLNIVPRRLFIAIDIGRNTSTISNLRIKKLALVVRENILILK